MKLLITGGTGFIGSAFIRMVLGGEQKNSSSAHSKNILKISHLTNVDNLKLSSNHSDLSNLQIVCNRYSFEDLDICNLDELRSVFKRCDPDAIIHLAAETHVDKSILYPRDFINTNVIGTLNLLEVSYEHWIKKGKSSNFRFLHVSTDEVFGMLGPTGRFSEESCYAPRNPYSTSKAASDHLVRSWHATYGLPVLISNCSNNFGPFQYPDKLIPKSISYALDKKPIPIYGSGQQIRDWINVADHTNALMTILAHGSVGRSYNVGAENERTNLQIVEEICQILDELNPSGLPHARLITFVGDRPGHDTRYAIDPSRIRSELNWYPKINFQDGLKATVEWYINNQSWWRKLLENENIISPTTLANHSKIR